MIRVFLPAVILLSFYPKDTHKIMPSTYSKNCSNVSSKSRSHAGLSRQLGNLRTNNTSHPRFGGSHGYPLWLRRDILFWEARFGVDFVLDRFDVSRATVFRWKARGPEPFIQTGNKEKDLLTGFDQFLLVIALYIYPRSSNDEVAMFIHVNGGTSGLSRESISQRLTELSVSRKRASVEAYDAYTPLNRQRCFNFFNFGPPVGINGIPIYRLMDVDEAKFKLEGCETNYGRSQKCVRVRDTGHYKRGERGLNLVLAVEPGNPMLPPHVYGSIYNPRKWWIITIDNVNSIIFADFMDTVCSDIENNPVPGNYNNERYIMWDNLTAHLTGIVTTTVELRPTRPQVSFTIINRPPYQPKFAPVEYIFCEIAMKLTHLVKPNWTLLHLRVAIEEILVQVGHDCKLNRTFRHCLRHVPR